MLAISAYVSHHLKFHNKKLCREIDDGPFYFQSRSCFLC